MLQGDIFLFSFFFMMHLLWEQGGIYRHLTVVCVCVCVCTRAHTQNSSHTIHDRH